MNLKRCPALVALMAVALDASAAIRYVDISSSAPTPPYTNWATAAQAIQDAVDAAGSGDEILVTNGVYRTGARLYGVSSNRVVVTKPMTLRSIRGPDLTIIEGYQVPDTTNGDSAIRCVYLADGTKLAGFTLRNGATGTDQYYPDSRSGGGGVYCESSNAIVSNCVIIANAARALGGGAHAGCLYDCVLSNNWSGGLGGGAYGNLDPPCIISNCVLQGNSAREGGGALGYAVFDCAINNNTANAGGGVAASSLFRCGLTNNYASQMGGAVGYGGCRLLDCFLISNTAPEGGGAGMGNFLTNCVLASNKADVRGGGAENSTLVHCQLLGNSCGGNGGGGWMGTMSDCILSDNYAPNGGGIYNGRLSNCVLSNNAAEAGGASAGSDLTNCVLVSNMANGSGGGAFGGTLYNCLLMRNTALVVGGGACDQSYASILLNNCTLVENTSATGGGVYGGTLNNCIVYNNTAPMDPNYLTYDAGTLTGSILNYCCTYPMPNAGTNNIVAAPQFVDETAGNWRLQTNSACVNAGSRDFVSGFVDLDGNPRIVGTAIDIGAYESQFPQRDAFHAWLELYGLAGDGSADYLDSDKDGMNNWQEWVCGTIPTNPESVLRLLSATTWDARMMILWQSVPNRTYFLERSTNLTAQPGFQLVSSNIPGQSGTTAFIDTNAPASGGLFYRVGVRQ